MAVGRAACTTDEAERRIAKCDSLSALLAVDGFNIITTLEAALSGGVLLSCQDSAIRDMASMHGTYRRVAETTSALELVAQCTVGSKLHWYLDRPVSNSGRLSKMIRDFAEERKLVWSVELVPDPDPILKESRSQVVTSDSAILDRVSSWFNLPRVAVEKLSDKWVVPLG